MKSILKIEIGFGLLALCLIYVIISSNASITGFVVGASPLITLVSPTEYFETQSTSASFMFKYSPEVSMQECSLKLNEQPVKTMNALLSFSGTKINKELTPGTYYWSIECIDSNGYTINSETRKITVLGEEEGELKVTRFFGDRIGTVYEFELKEGLELQIPGTVPNDVIRAKQGKNIYEISLLRVSQDYSKDLEFVELIITPGQKRLTLFTGDSTMIDFNNDGMNDLSLALDDVSYRKATFTASTKQLEQATPAQGTGASSTAQPATTGTTTGKATQATVSNPAASRSSSSSTALYSQSGAAITWLPLIVIVAVIIAGIYLIRKNKKESEQSYAGSLGKPGSAKPAKKPLASKARKAKR